MRILLIGEYSRLHNSLKEGLLVLGHEVVLASDGDDFKNYPNDLSYDAKWSKSKLFYYPRRVFLKLFKLDLATLERGIRFYFLLPKLNGFDVVQLINEAAINTSVSLEIYLLQKVKEQNGKLFLLSSGADAISVQFMLENKFKYSILTPYLEKRETRNEYPYILRYVSKNHLRLHYYIFENINGVIATDFDYVLPLLGHQKYSGMVPNPINTSKIDFSPLVITDKIVLFLGVNRYNYIKKGIRFFEEALAEIEKKYGDKVEIIITENIPYEQYIELYNKAHILLDQVYAYDQGYNALEAMAKGKVVFTGAEEDFAEHYQLTERVAINALPDVNDLVKELSFLIDNPEEIIAIGKRARTFIEKEHEYRMIGKSYIKKWADY